MAKPWRYRFLVGMKCFVFFPDFRSFLSKKMLERFNSVESRFFLGVGIFLAWWLSKGFGLCSESLGNR